MFKEYPYEELYFLEGCKRVRDKVKNAQLVYIGGCHTMESLETVMAEGIDFVQIGRALIKDPNYVNNAMVQQRLTIEIPMAQQIGLVWLAHCAFDRTIGWGLKYEDSFCHTDLGTNQLPIDAPLLK
ncbi:hypothetical protein CAPTEDRAFT_201706 [Capitella teleta]|uniref:NADH:flavin oxidoreductase/NADH oxidase N-terminal domain-containing protein n=1 Tax=Capitella teleta TaxID=283909 RepID=R7UQM2_CAPTE|nr:hypothetical protein CAPTEDRAFT_201706 [Capitella teleta]|eukprot:ELU08408.1 hypothetical protein CAPTEDRAFT_201706 [Capitella teleta]